MMITKKILIIAGILGYAPFLLKAQGEMGAHYPSVSNIATDEIKTDTTVAPGYWYIGMEFFSPIIYDDLYSWTRHGGKFHFGKGIQLKAGYQFSPVFGVEVNVGVGYNQATASKFQHDYVLGVYDAYTYYPYTLINGNTYYYPAEDLVGEQGKHIEDVKVEGVSFKYLQSRIRFLQSSINATFNITRLFYTSVYSEKPIELWIKPGVYLSHFRSQLYDTNTGKKIAPRINRTITWGFGGDIAVRFNLSRKWSIEAISRLVWERDHAIDGILNAKRAYDSYVWQPAIGVTYKFHNRQSKNIPRIISQPEKNGWSTIPELDFWYPEEVSLPENKQRSHSASIYLTYPLNQTFISRGLYDNEQELARLNHELDTYLYNPDYTVNSIRIEGFASPEGPYGNNINLAQGRAQSIINYIIEHSHINREMLSTGRMVENWAGLRDTLLHNPELPGRDKFLELIESIKDTETLKVRLKREPEYATLLREVYPHLRQSTYTVNYLVRNYKANEARELIYTHPEMLSPEEIYSVALSYGLGSEEADKAISVLYTQYPNADIKLSVEGITLLLQGESDQAIEKLESVLHKSPTVLNALGVAYAYRGNIAKAKALWRQAAPQNTQARKNLNRFNRYTNKSELRPKTDQ
ncbi:hypothetical protein ACJEEI_07355 [Bacteroides uniformis]|uniref:hypothetical protein n=1 Tax=Bacteroides uniformis TaxID=820 RepID=UPI00397B2841